MMKEELKDNIDFGNESVPRLFRRLLIPTLFGMLFGMLFNIVDGMFVGRFIGTDGLAAINIAAPMFLVCVGVALMLGMGGSVIASIHLSRGKLKTARIVATQSLIATGVLLAITSLLVVIFREPVLRASGCTERLLPLAEQYLVIYVPTLFLHGIFLAGGFFIRLSGDPKLEMAISISSSVLNMILDYLMIVVLRWGIMGAAVATAISIALSGVATLVYMFWPSVKLRFIKLKTHRRAMKLTFRNIGYMCKLGLPTFLGEIATAFLMIIGNNVFVRLAAEDGVAAFSVVCYLMPVIFMVYAAIAQSAQPIISFNYGIGQKERMRKMYFVAMETALGYAAVLLLCAELFAPAVVGIFMHSEAAAFPLAVRGIKLYSLILFPLAINLVYVCICQSVEQSRRATIISTLRGYIFVLLCFLVLPGWLGIDGAWIAVPVAETLTMFVVLGMVIARRNKDNTSK